MRQEASLPDANNGTERSSNSLHISRQLTPNDKAYRRYRSTSSSTQSPSRDVRGRYKEYYTERKKQKYLHQDDRLYSSDSTREIRKKKRQSKSRDASEKKSRRLHSESSSEADSSVKQHSQVKKKHRRNRSVSSTSSNEEKDSRSKKKRKYKKHSTKHSFTGKWGKYGVLQECDLWVKRPEFQIWLMETKNRSLEELPPWEEKSLFRDYMEDYNTGTHVHKKYYNLEKWETSRALKQKNKIHESKDDTAFFDDESKRRNEIRVIQERRRHNDITSAYKDMREDTDKISAMRHQHYLQTKMKALFRMGQVDEAQKIRDRLKPDDEA